MAQIFLRLAPAKKFDALIAGALCDLEASPRLQTFLKSAASVPNAICAYKSAVLQDLAAIITRNQKSVRISDQKDDELFSRFLPVPSSPESEAQSPTKKRAIAEVDDVLLRIPKKSKVPALASCACPPRCTAERVRANWG